MSTTPAATASKSLASSTAFKTFAIVFGVGVLMHGVLFRRLFPPRSGSAG